MRYGHSDKIITVDKRELGERIGILAANQMKDISDQLVVVLGL